MRWLFDMSPFCRSHWLGGLVNIAAWVGRVLVNVTDFSTAARNTAWSHSCWSTVRGWCFTLSFSFCVTFQPLFQTHILNIHVYLKATSISFPLFCLVSFSSICSRRSHACVFPSSCPPPLLIQMKMYLCCMTDSSMVSAFSTLFNFKSTTQPLSWHLCKGRNRFTSPVVQNLAVEAKNTSFFPPAAYSMQLSLNIDSSMLAICCISCI